MFKIYAPSYKRPKGKTTHLLLPELTYVVAESERESYLASGEHDKFWFVPDTAQGNTSRIRNYILDHAETKQILSIDDDHTRFGIWLDHKRQGISTEEVMSFIASMFQLCIDGDFRFWGVLPNNDNLSYREYSPFSLSAFIGGPWMGFNNCECRFDEKIPLKEDYDFTLQVMNRYRRALRCNYFIYYPKQHNNGGGCATYRNSKFEKDQLAALQKKWGAKIVRTGSDNAGARAFATKELDDDINPIIKVPIKGI